MRYNGRFPYENPRIAYLAHNKWIQEIIPPENLLIFDVKEGWGPLVKFLGMYVVFSSISKNTSYRR